MSVSAGCYVRVEIALEACMQINSDLFTSREPQVPLKLFPRSIWKAEFPL